MCVWWYQSPMHFNIVALVSEIASYKQMLEMVIKRLNDRPIVLVTMALMYDAQCTMHDEVLAETAIEDYNTFLYSLAQENTNVKVVDIRRFYQQYPQDEWLDWKFYMMSQMGLNPRLSAAFQQWWKREMDAIALKRKKCLVLDLDNTLWGGILGEDGVEGIRLSGDYPGKAYHLWQEGLNNKAICEKLHYDTKTVTAALQNFNITKEQRQQRGRENIIKPILMLDKNTEEILQVFSSMESAFKYLNKQSSGHIAAVCKGKRKTAYGL